MKVCVFGAGYVGLVTAACLADMGNSVVCLDVDPARVAGLQQGHMPIHEPGLKELVQRNAAAGRLHFTVDAAMAVAHGTIVFIAVGTPSSEDGSADLGHVLAAAATIGQHMADYKVIVNKSTVPVGTAEKVHAGVASELRQRAAVLPFAVVSNPEFLKEGVAIDDFMRPDRVIIGADDEQATLMMRALYAPFLRNRDRLLLMDLRSAELTKYVANAMLAARISFMNEMAALSEQVGADIEQVRVGIGSDPRIGTHFLYAGCGWGGSCLPKDVQALQRMGQDAGVDLPMLAACRPSTTASANCCASVWCSSLASPCRATPSPCGAWPSSPAPTTCVRHPAWSSSMNCCAVVRVCRPLTRWPCRAWRGTGPTGPACIWRTTPWKRRQVHRPCWW
jgi:UDPglucose 6-dehydrogenase